MAVGTVAAVFVLVVAKQPLPGRVKTRLCPPCTPEQAAAIAEAALADTMAAAVSSGADEVLVALDGEPGPWLPDGVRTFPQVDGPFDRRLTAAWAETTGPGIQIGMDTPQLDADTLDAAMHELASPATDAVLGPAADGGWWAIGLPAADDRVFTGIPMSRADTGDHQRTRLAELGYRVTELPTLVDVDHFDDALDVAATTPASRFAGAVAAVEAPEATPAP